MKFIQAIFVYTVLINICVNARGGHGGGSHGGHGGHGSHGGHWGHGSSSHSPGPHGFHYVTASHTHYTYHPPRSISYTCRYCSSSSTYPVYRQPPPSYVYVYKDSGSRYNQLLTGLALYNLGRTAGGGSHSNLHYASRPQEKCSMQIIERSHFEETELPCFMLSTFIQSSAANNSHTIDITSQQIDVKPYINTGDPIEVNENQQCVLWHNLTTYKERNQVPCKLLKEYANTVKPSGVPVYIWLPMLLGAILLIYICCSCCNKKKKKESGKEAAPINEGPVAGYSSNYYE